MTDSGRHAVRRSRWLTGGLIAVGAAVFLTAAVSAALALVMARTVVIPPTKRKEDTAVLGVDPREGTITLSASADAVVPGRYSFWFDSGAGHARIGEIVRSTAASVTRLLIGVDRGDLDRARSGRFNGWFYLTPADLGLAYDTVEIATPVGAAPAWLIPAERASERWVIQVHGRAVSRAETLRAVPVFRDAGYTSLVVSYRNDGDAPASADGRYALGDSEWMDIEAALGFALDRGAREVVLMGWSMGGATVLQVVTRSSLASMVRGIVLESPVVDWVTALDFQARLAHLPKSIGTAAQAVIGRPWGRRLTGQRESIDFDRLDLVGHADRLNVPILLLHSDDDGFVPSTASHALAAARPDIVTMETFTVARHTKLWNYEPVRWNAAIANWLAALHR